MFRRRPIRSQAFNDRITVCLSERSKSKGRPRKGDKVHGTCLAGIQAVSTSTSSLRLRRRCVIRRKESYPPRIWEACSFLLVLTAYVLRCRTSWKAATNRHQRNHGSDQLLLILNQSHHGGDLGTKRGLATCSLRHASTTITTSSPFRIRF